MTKQPIAPLLIDFYKAVHAEQYPQGLTRLVSYFTPRSSRIHQREVVSFGMVGVAKTYLCEYFNQFFFDLPEDQVVAEYERVLKHTMPPSSIHSDKIRALHQLGHLPVRVSILPEGTLVPIQVPCIQMESTDENFAWVVQALESLISAEMWHPMICATVGYMYRKLVNKYFELTVEDDVPAKRALGDFSFRGQHCLQSAVKSSAAWLLSFVNTSNVPSICWLEDLYDLDLTTDEIGYGAVSTEHSCMCANFAVDGDEKTHVERLLTEIYPDCAFSMVSDSYNYPKMVAETIPSLKSIIEKRDFPLLVRPDSGQPDDVICGTLNIVDFDVLPEYQGATLNEAVAKLLIKQENMVNDLIDNKQDVDQSLMPKAFKYEGKYYKILGYNTAWADDPTTILQIMLRNQPCSKSSIKVVPFTPNFDELGSLNSLIGSFGATLNSKGFLVLPKYIRLIYGDSITLELLGKIYIRLHLMGIAVNNLVCGVGSFSMMCIQEDGQLKPFTRDTFGIAMKATYGEINNQPIPIYKDPIGDSGKRSQRGMCHVYRDANDKIVVTDGLDYDEVVTLSNTDGKESLFTPIFENGKMLKFDSLNVIRDRLHDGNF